MEYFQFETSKSSSDFSDMQLLLEICRIAQTFYFIQETKSFDCYLSSKISIEIENFEVECPRCKNLIIKDTCRDSYTYGCEA